MSLDSMDDLHHAEDTIGELQIALVNLVRAAKTDDSELFGDYSVHLERAERLGISAYCRPSCDDDCDEDCGCPCHDDDVEAWPLDEDGDLLPFPDEEDDD
jgi:hypothetical protein